MVHGQASGKGARWRCTRNEHDSCVIPVAGYLGSVILLCLLCIRLKFSIIIFFLSKRAFKVTH